MPLAPRPPRSAPRVLLLTGSLLTLSLGCESKSKSDEAPVLFRAVDLPATESKGELHPLSLRARTINPEPGIEPALRTQQRLVTREGARRMHLIAQLRQLPDEKQWAAFQARGIHRAAFLHGRSFILGIDLPDGDEEQRLEQVRVELDALALLRFAPEDRIPPALLEGRFSPHALVKGTAFVRLGVRLFPDTPRETVERLLQRVHRGPDAPERPNPDMLVLETDAEGLRALSQEDAVHDVGEQTPPEPLLHRVRESTGADWVQAIDTNFMPPVYYGVSGSGVRISVGGEQIDDNHDDFWNHDGLGNRTTSRLACPPYADAHGTHVGGIVMGNGFRSQGKYRGMAPQATAVCYGQRPDVSNHSYVVDWDGLYDGWTAQQDADLNNPSSGYYHLHVNAAGNQGIGSQYGNTSGYYSVLASRKNALAVANIDSVDYRWGGSSMGPTLDGRLKPEISAPGSLSRFPDRNKVLFELDSVTVKSNGTSVLTWDFDVQNQFQGWAATSNWYHQGCIDPVYSTPVGSGWAMAVPMLYGCKAWVATSTQANGSALALQSNASHSVTLRYRFEPTPMWNNETGLLWWAQYTTSSYDYTSFPIIPDGQWHTVTVDVGQHPAWSGKTIQLLRISPVAHSDRTILSTGLTNDYVGMSGSSMAAPAVTGATALLLERMVTRHGVVLSQQGAPSPFWRAAPGVGPPMPSTLKALLVHSAKDLASIPRYGEPGIQDTGWSPLRYHKGPDFATGYGALDVTEALRLVDRGTVVEQELTSSAFHQYTLAVPGGSTALPQPLKVTLAWSDPAGSGATAQVVPRLVNDLDLVLVAPNGQRHHPWTLAQPYVPSNANNTPDLIEPEPISPSAIQPAVRVQADHLNNLEQVYVENPMPGTWTVEVRPAALAAPPQRYSLVLGTPSKPALNLSGGRVAWSSNRVSPAQIFWRTNQSGAPLQQVSFGPNAAVTPAWAPNGQLLAYISDEQVGGVLSSSLIIANTSGTQVVRWNRPLGTRYVTHPSWSWDARHLTFGYYDAWGCQGIGIVDFSSPYAFSTAVWRVLIPASCDPNHLDPTEPDFSADGAWVYVSSTQNYPQGPGGLYRIPSGGGALEQIHGDGVPLQLAYSVSLSSDGKRALYNSELYLQDPVQNKDEEVIGLDLETGVTTQITFEAGHQSAYFATGGRGEMILNSQPVPSGNPTFFLVENGTRRIFDTNNPGNVYVDRYPAWWKQEPRCLATPPSGLRAWYALDGLSGTQFVDLAGGSPGTSSGAVLTEGMVRQALSFSGGGSAQVPAQSQLNVGTGDFTLMAWMRMPLAGGIQSVLDKRQDAPLRGYHLAMYNGCPLLQLADAVGAGYGNYVSSVCVADGAWHHVAISIRRNRATDGIQFYVDGMASSAFSSTSRNGSLDSSSALTLGRYSLSNEGLWNGALDEVMLFGRALGREEVQSLAFAGPSGVCR